MNGPGTLSRAVHSSSHHPVVHKVEFQGRDLARESATHALQCTRSPTQKHTLCKVHHRALPHAIRTHSWAKITGGKAPMTDGLAAMIDTL